MPDNDLIKKFEGFRAAPYLCPAGVPTIGWGSTHYENGETVKIDDPPISRERADKMLELYVVRTRVRIRAKARGLFGVRMEALESFAYNLGTGALFGSTLFRKVKARNHRGAALQFPRWVYARGRKLRGLVRRREAEKKRYLKVCDDCC